MVYDIFNNAGRYFSKDTDLYKAIIYARDFQEDHPDGIFELDGENMFSIVKTYETFPYSEKLFETHSEYIDVQTLIFGSESIHVSLGRDHKVAAPYSRETDKVQYVDVVDFSTLLVRPGYFAIFYPGDLHRADCHWNEKTLVRKIAVKVRIKEFLL